MNWLGRKTSTLEYEWRTIFSHVSCLHSFVLLSKGLVKMCHVVNCKMSNFRLWKRTYKQHTIHLLFYAFILWHRILLFLQNRQEVYVLIVSFNTFFLSCASFYRMFLDYSFANFFLSEKCYFQTANHYICLHSNSIQFQKLFFSQQLFFAIIKNKPECFLAKCTLSCIKKGFTTN